MQLETNRTDDYARLLVDHYADDLVRWGVLTDEEQTTIGEALERADAATVVAAGIEARRAESIVTVAAKLSDITEAAVTAAAVKIASDDAAHDLCLVLWRRAMADAKAPVVRAFTRLPAVLSARLDALADRGLAAHEELGSITTAQGAITAGVVDAWTEFTAVQSEYAAVRSFVSDLRWGLSERPSPLIAAPARTDRSEDRWSWDFRNQPAQVVSPGFRSNGYSDAERRALFVAELEARPYVAASAAEAAEVRAGELVSA